MGLNPQKFNFNISSIFKRKKIIEITIIVYSFGGDYCCRDLFSVSEILEGFKVACNDRKSKFKKKPSS